MSIKRGMNQTGDTIVEVLIAIAVASAVLGSAYAIVNRTVRSQQQTSEHTNALKIAESQLELLRNHNGTVSSSFCFNPTYQSTDDPSCNTVTAGITYDPTITKNETTVGSQITTTYTVNVSWPSLGGGTDKVDLVYKVYK